MSKDYAIERYNKELRGLQQEGTRYYNEDYVQKRIEELKNAISKLQDSESYYISCGYRWVRHETRNIHKCLLESGHTGNHSGPAIEIISQYG